MKDFFEPGSRVAIKQLWRRTLVQLVCCWDFAVVCIGVII